MSQIDNYSDQHRPEILRRVAARDELRAKGEALARDFDLKAETRRLRILRWHYRRMAESIRRDLRGI